MPKKTTIVLATNNHGKVREIKKLLSGLAVSIKSMDQYKNIPKIVEDGKTFEANARKKAQVVSRRTKLITLADDSGLMVNALNGRPGVRSARYVNPPATSERLCLKLLKEIKDAKDKSRGAKFVCAAAIAIPGKKTRILKGICRGRIIKELRGNRGFGYDPVFKPCKYNKTFAEMSLGQKNRLSHRAVAFKKAVKYLKILI
jgi:XTP/dITP diphosphohydrolase